MQECHTRSNANTEDVFAPLKHLEVEFIRQLAHTNHATYKIPFYIETRRIGGCAHLPVRCNRYSRAASLSIVVTATALTVTTGLKGRCVCGCGTMLLNALPLGSTPARSRNVFLP